MRELRNTVLLVNPPEERCLPGGEKKPIFWAGDYQAYPPVNLLYLASFLKRERPGLRVLVKDYVVEPYSERSLRSLLEEEKPFLVGFTCFSTSLHPTMKACEFAKRCDPTISLIVGGPHAAIFPRETMSLPFVDAVCEGEGERTLLEAVDRCLSGDSMTGVVNLWTRSGGSVIPPSRKGLAFQDLDEAAFPDLSMVDLRKYYRPFLAQGGAVIPVLTGRGCPFRCSFCNSRSIQFQLRKMESVLEEVSGNVSRFGVRNVYILDDTFNVKIERLMAFSEGILSRGLRIVWSFKGRVDGVDERSLRLAKRAGLVHIAMGVEDFTDEGLRKVRKGITCAQVRETFALCHRLGIHTTANFIIGLPHNQDAARQRKLYDFIIEIDPTTIQVFILQLIPGSDLYDEALQQGVITGEEWPQQARKPEPGFALPGWQDGLSMEEQLAINHEINRRFYRRPGYLLHRLLEVRNLRDLATKIRVGWSILRG